MEAGLLVWVDSVPMLPDPWVVVLLSPDTGCWVPMTGVLVLLEVVDPTVPVAGTVVPVAGSELLLDEAVPEDAEAPEALPPDQRVDMLLGLSLLP